jgi:hypothetical protein
MRQQLARKVLELCGLPELRPRAVAATLGSVLGPARSVTPVRTEHDLGESQLIAGGTVAVADRWIAVSFRPAPSVALTRQDLEPLLLDRPHRRDPLIAHRPEGPSIRSVDHMFLVNGLALVVRLPPEADAPGTAPAAALVEEIVVNNSPPSTLIKAPTLRARRAPQAR